jgi:aminoglycoside/choline kinase family phosphotransferase
VVPDHEEWLLVAATRLGWADGWRARFWSCAAQRGLKVIGTFMRLASEGRVQYRTMLPEVRRRCVEALRALAAPPSLLAAVAEESPGKRGV